MMVVRIFGFLTLLFLIMGPATAEQRVARDVVRLLFQSSREKPADLRQSDLRRLDLAEVDFKGANLQHVDLSGADVTRANLGGCSMVEANLDSAVLTGTDFSEADLSRATIRRPSIFHSLEPSKEEAPRFTGAKLKDAWLLGVFDFSDFSNADLTSARLGPLNIRDNQGVIVGNGFRSANFHAANLRGTSLQRANLSFADLSSANLTGADLRGADISRTNFRGADVTGADFTGATIDGTDFSDVLGLSTVKGFSGLP